MTNEEATTHLKCLAYVFFNKSIVIDCKDQEALQRGIEALEILEFAKKELQFAVEHTEGETKEHYQRALNLLK